MKIKLLLYSGLNLFALAFSLNAQSDFNKGMSVFVEMGALIRDNSSVNSFLNRSDLLGRGYGFENFEPCLNVSAEFRLIDSIRIRLSTCTSDLPQTQFEKGIASLNRRSFLVSLNYYYLNRNRTRASIGLSFGSSSTSLNITENNDTIHFINGHPMLPYEKYEFGSSTLSNSSRIVGIEHRIEKEWRSFGPDKKKRLRFISFGIYNQLNYSAGTNRWKYRYPSMFMTAVFSEKTISNSWQFQMGIYARWHFNKKEDSKQVKNP